MSVLIRNSTDIPNRLIEIVVAFTAQDGIKLSEVVVKNKQEGKLHGKAGWYHSVDHKVVVNIPQVIPAHGFQFRLKYSGLSVRLMTRAEWLVAVMAHELRHAWQYQSASSASYKLSKPLRERDAEQYEYGMLAKWRAQFNQRVSAA